MPLTDAQKIDFEIVVQGTLAALGGQAQQTITPLHYRRASFGSAYDAAQLLTAFHAAVQTQWLACCSVSWNWDLTKVRCLNSPTEAFVQSTVNLAGGIIGDMLPSYAAAVFHKASALRGRSYNGRMYLAGIPESGTTGNALTAGQKILTDALATVLDGPVTTAAGITYNPTVLSRKLSNLVIDPSVIVATPVVLVTSRSVLGRLSSRRSTVA